MTRRTGMGVAIGMAAAIGSACALEEPASTTRVDNGTESSTPTDATSAAETTGHATTGGDGHPTRPSGDTTIADGSGGSDSGEPPAQRGATTENLRVAFFGDHGLGPDSLATLQLVLAEDADFLVILGDFDYRNDPAAWHEQLDEGLGEDFPVFAVAGNHDTAKWDDYREVLMDRLAPIADVDCQGAIGVQMNCLYHGLDLVLSGVGTMPAPADRSHVDFIQDTLAESDAIWRVCAWHKNQHDMQLGYKSDEVGWPAYQACQAGGAIIATGHEHSYGRTRTLTNLGDHDGEHGVVGPPELVYVSPGSTFVFVSGMGGNEIRYFGGDHADDTWWATQYTRDVYVANGDPMGDFEPKLGVTFIDFHVDGDPYKARGYFKNVAGEMIDEFTIYAAH